MRNLGLMAAITLLASCGSQETGNIVGSESEPPPVGAIGAEATENTELAAVSENSNAAAQVDAGTASAYLMQDLIAST